MKKVFIAKDLSDDLDDERHYSCNEWGEAKKLYNDLKKKYERAAK